LHVVKILADQNIPCVADAFRDLGEVQLMPGRDIRREHLRDCRCLVTRTVTRVDRELLDGTPVEFVGTATIGTDHIDLDYLRSAGIGCSNAAGCNAEAASEYVVSGLFALSKRNGFDPFRLRAGIVGHGNVGSRLRQKLDALGIDCLLCDPPLQEAGDSSQDFVDLDTILQECSFISLHVPLTRDGSHPTYHLLDRDRLPNLAAGCLLVNAARGEVVDNAALNRWSRANCCSASISRLRISPATAWRAGYAGRKWYSTRPARISGWYPAGTCRHCCRQSRRSNATSPVPGLNPGPGCFNSIVISGAITRH
jgi:erythronate-4-phosphate dehydrogenase